MGFWSKAVTTFRRRTLDIKNPSGWNGGDARPAGEEVTPSSVLGLSAAWACVNLIAGTIATLPLMVYRTKKDGSREVAKDHPLYRILHDNPNTDQTAVDYLEFVQSSLEFWGNSYSRIVRSGEKPVSLLPIRPDIMSVDRDDRGRVRYRWSEDGQYFERFDDTVLHIRGFGGGPLGGLSTLSFARDTFGLAMATDRAARETFRNGMRPAGQFVFKEFLTPDQREQLDERLTNKYLGAINAGRPYIAEGGAEYKPISINPDDAQMLETRGFSVDEVCRFFGVPPFMIGHTEKSTSWGTGLAEQVLGFQKFNLRRRLKRIEQSMEKRLLTPADRAAGVVIEFNLEGLLRGDSAARAAYYGAGLKDGWLNINQVCAWENLPPVEGGDVNRVQMQNVPLTEAGKEPAATPQPGAPKLRVVGSE
ncbi:phage portal protein [Bradyrhizobium sp. 18]|uniref:phage portal protein n=1 Tax=Bradyrhizobium sp. 18 TaxID=2782657 RepID=UPI001FF813C1|nr:phage portal protein [Bradyrhizobium sp. 18]MCK1503873.1 phage portal protein [Bradyrhizobium sp. 18]